MWKGGGISENHKEAKGCQSSVVEQEKETKELMKERHCMSTGTEKEMVPYMEKQVIIGRTGGIDFYCNTRQIVGTQ